MKIGIDGSRAEGQKTGVGWYSYQILKNLSFLSQTDEFKRDNFFIYTRKNLNITFPKNVFLKKLHWPLKFIWSHLRLNWEILFHPIDVLFIPAASIPLFYFKKSVVTIHDLGFKRFPRAYSLLQRIYYRFVHFWNIKVADVIIVPSDFTKKEILKTYNVKSDKIRVCPLGYNKKVFHEKKESGVEKILKKFNIDQPYFLYVGRLEKKKNVLELIKAFKEFKINYPNVKLVLAGNPGFGYKNIRSEIKNNKNILEPGYVKLKDLSGLYKGAVAFIFPSLYEGFGIPVLESFASGTPAILSENGSLKEVGGKAALYYNPGEKDQLVYLMEKVLNNKEVSHLLKTKGKKRAQNYSWQKCSLEILRILKKT